MDGTDGTEQRLMHEEKTQRFFESGEDTNKALNYYYNASQGNSTPTTTARRR
jgi:hypothetical protein